MTEKTKNVNYTPEQTTQLVAAYNAADSDESRAAVVTSFAEAFEKKPASIRAKLVREGVYQKPAASRKRTAKKADMVQRIAKLAGTDSEKLDSLEKATANALKVVIAALETHESEISEG